MPTLLVRLFWEMYWQNGYNETGVTVTGSHISVDNRRHFSSAQSFFTRLCCGMPVPPFPLERNLQNMLGLIFSV